MNSNQNISTPIIFIQAVEEYFNLRFLYDMAADVDDRKAPEYCSDSLDIDWPIDGWCWLNPPFGMQTKFIKKCVEQSNRGCKIISIWPLSGDKNQISTWTEAGIHVIHGRIWPEVRGCMLCDWSKRCAGEVVGLSWDKKNLKRIW